jgi:hypothetical protein
MNPDDYQIKYWPADSSYLNEEPKKRSIKRKLAIVASFLFVLAVTPSMIYALTNFSLEKNENSKVSVVETVNTKVTPEVHKVTIEEPKEPKTQQSQSNILTVINNDSYWKISVRACGTGRYYLSIKAQNGGKALYQGDTVVANCTL